MSLNKGSPEYLHALANKLRQNKLLTTCVDCVHFYQEDTNYHCGYWEMVPPLEHVVTGCPQWSPVDNRD